MCKQLLPLFIFPLIISSDYTLGTENAVATKYGSVVNELDKAAALYPNLARYHNNLVCAYIALNKWDKAWVHARQAVLCSIPDNVGTYYFDFFCRTLIYEKGLHYAGTDAKELLEKLGVPEMAMYGLDTHDLEMCTYGLLSIKFKNGKLVECKRLDQTDAQDFYRPKKL